MVNQNNRLTAPLGPKAQARADQAAIDKRRRELLDEKQTMDARKVEQVQNELRRQIYADINKMQFAPQNPIQYKNTVPAVELSQAPIQPGTESAVGGPETPSPRWAMAPQASEQAQPKWMQAPAATSVEPLGGTGEFDPKAFAGLNVIQPKPLHDGNDAINAGIEEAAALVLGGYANFQKQKPDPARMQAMGYVQDPLAKGGYAKPAQPQDPVVNNPSANNLFTDAARFLEAPVRGLTGGGLEGWARTTSEDPLLGANEAVDFISPIDDAGRAYQGLKQAGAGAIDGDWQRAGEGLKQAAIDGSFTAMQVLPGSMTLKGVTAPGRAATATAQTLADAERAAVAASRAGPVPKPSKPPPMPLNAQAAPAPFSAPATPASGNIIARNADRIVTGGIGATIGGAADAFAAPGDGGGDGEGGTPIGAGIGAGIGIFGPRAVASAASRGFRAAARPFRPVGFDERVAARAVRNALKSGGITTPEQAAAAMTARFGEKPASVADLTQEGVGTAAGLSRLPGATGEAARARGEDLLQNRAGRLEGDIAQANPSLNPAAIAGDVDRMVQLAQSQAKPAYDGLRARYPLGSIVSDRLEQLRGLDILAPHLRGVDRYRETLAATEGRVVGDFEYWDLVKRSLDDTEQAAVARNQPVPYDLDSTRQAIVQEMDRLVPDYPAARELGGEAPKMRDAFKQGQALLGGRYTAEDVSRLIQGITGQQLTAAQAGVIRSMVAKTEGARGAMASLMSTGARRKLAQVFGPDAADAMQARFAADAAIVNNAQRINPNVGSVTSQAQLGGGIGPMVADAIRAVRSPAEAALAALSRSGSYSQAQRDLMGQMLLDGVTPENLERIFRSRTPRGPRPAPGGPAAPPTGGGSGPAAPSGNGLRPRGPRPAPSEEAVLSAMAQVNQLAAGRPAPRGPMGPPVREAMWNGPVPSKPQSLLAWIRSQGGINDTNYMTGDLTAIMGRANGMPGLLNRKSGQGLDDLAAAAYHQGFDVNPDDANSLVRLIEEEFGGNPNYRLGAKEEWDAYQETLRARRGPLPGETSNASPAVTGALVTGGLTGGATYAATGDEDLAFKAGGLATFGGAVAGNRLAKFGGGHKPPKPPVPKAPVAGGPVATKDRAVWEMRGAGLSNAEIARRADTTESMVDVHYRKAERALGAPPSDPSVLSKYPEKAPTQAAATVSTAEPFTSKAGNATLNYEERPFWWADDSLDVSMDYVPEKPPTLSETKDLFTQMYDRMKAKMQAEGRSVYSANGDTPSKRKLYDSAVKALPPPDGYTPMKSPGSDMILFVRNDMVGKLPEGAPKDLAPISSVTPLKPAPKPPTRQGMGSSKLPMDEGARMERRKAWQAEKGPVDETVLYHGTRADFADFDVSAKSNWDKSTNRTKAVFLTASPEEASGFSQGMNETGNAHVRPVYARGKLKEIDWKQQTGKRLFDMDAMESILRSAKKNGYDGVRIKGMKDVYGDADQIAIFNPKNIRGKFAKFDPAESSSSKLLAGLGGPSGAGAAGGGILGYALNPADANGDGVIDDLDRGLNGFGGMVSGGIAGKALGSRAAGKFGNQMKGAPRTPSGRPRYFNSQGFFGDPIAKPGAEPPTIKLSDLKGAKIFHTTADHTRTGGAYTGIDSSLVDNPVPLPGGPKYGLRPDNAEHGVAFANNGGVAGQKVTKITNHGATHMIINVGDTNQHISSVTANRAFFDTMRAYVRDGRISQKNARAITKLIKNSVTKDEAVHAAMKAFPGFEDVQALDDYARSISFEARKRLLTLVGSKDARELGAPNLKRILDATREPGTAGRRWGDGEYVVKLDPNGTLVKLGDQSAPEHPDFPTGIRGEVIGKLDAPINYETLAQDWLAADKASKLAANPNATLNQRRGFDMARPVIEVTDDLLSRIGEIKNAGISSARHAKLTADFAADNWRVSNLPVKQGGSSPADFINAIDDSPGAAVLDMPDLSTLKKDIRSGKTSIYQLGDDGQVFFSLERGDPSYEASYGIKTPGIGPNEVKLGGVINNELGAGGMGHAVMLKALTEGATVLDAFAVKSAAHPDGFLPEFYKKFGFEVVAEVPFDKKYYTPQKLADAVDFWKKSTKGYDPEINGYPPLVIMKWTGTDAQRANLVARYHGRGLQDLFGGRDTPHAQADAEVFVRDAAGKIGKAGSGGRQARGAGGDQGHAGKPPVPSALTRATRGLSNLSDAELRNLGRTPADREAARKSLGLKPAPRQRYGPRATAVPTFRREPVIAQQGFFNSGKAESRPKPPPNKLASGPPKPRPVEARRAAPRGNKPFSDPRLSPGERLTAEMMLNGHTYEEIADEMMTSVEVVRVQATRAQKKLGADVQLPRPGQGKRPLGTTKREAAFELFDQGLPSSLVAERIGMPRVNVSNYRGQWMKERAAARAPVASTEGAAYNPPAMPARPFEADYPQKDWPDGPPVDAQGRLTRDMDGRPLDQTSVVIGRNKASGYGPESEADRSLRDRIAVIQTLKKAGSRLKRVPRSPDQTSGAWLPKFNDQDRYTGRGVVQITDDLDRPVAGLDDQEVITLSHELAHSIDFKVNPSRNTDDFNNRKWGIDHKNPYMTPEIKAELESQLQRIYRDLNNPVDGEVKIRTPKDRGYGPIDEDRELWAEAIRAYMYDPNYIKTVAPDVAFMIRDHVNRNSSLRKTIQFNAVPTIVGLGGLGLGAAALSSQPAEAQNR